MGNGGGVQRGLFGKLLSVGGAFEACGGRNTKARKVRC